MSITTIYNTPPLGCSWIHLRVHAASLKTLLGKTQRDKNLSKEKRVQLCKAPPDADVGAVFLQILQFTHSNVMNMFSES